MTGEQGWLDTFYVHEIQTLSDKSYISQIALNPSILVSVELDSLGSSGCFGQTKSFTVGEATQSMMGTLFKTTTFFGQRNKG